MTSFIVISLLVSIFVLLSSLSPVLGIAFLTAFRTISLLATVPIGSYAYSGEGFLTLSVIVVGCIFILFNFHKLKGIIKWPFILFILFSGLTFIVAEDTANFYKKFARLIGYFFLYLMVVQLSIKRENRKILTYAFIISLFVTNLPALYMYFISPSEYMNQLQGGLQEVGIMPKNNFGFFSCYMTLFLAYLYMTARSGLQKLFFLSLFFMQAALLVMSFTRTAWAGFLAGFAVLLFFSKNKARLLVPVVSIVLVVASLSSIVYYGAYGEITEKKEYGYSSLHFRTEYAWPASITAFREKPTMGWGLGNDRYALTKAAKFNQTSHNDYLLVLVEAGIIGLALYAWLLIALLMKTRDGIRGARDGETRMLCVTALAILVSYLVGSLGEHLLQTPGATGSAITILGMAHGTLLESSHNGLQDADTEVNYTERDESPFPE